MRERLLEQVRARLEQFNIDRNAATVLEPEAISEVAALLAAVGGPAVDVEAAHAAGWLHWLRYLVLDPGDDQQDLAAALTLFGLVHQARPDAVPDQVRARFESSGLTMSGGPEVMAGRALTLLRETLRTGDRAALDTAIDLFRQALAATPGDHPDRAEYLFTLGTALRTRFERTGNQADIDEAITASRAAAAATPHDSLDHVTCLSNLGAVLGMRFERTGRQADLDEAVGILQEVVAATPPDYPDRATRLSNLGSVLLIRFERTGSQADLDAAVDAGRQAVAASPVDHPDRVKWLSNLCGALYARFWWTGSQADLDAAVDAGRQAVAASPADLAHRATILSNLCGALRIRFERTGSTADLDAAVDAGRQAVAAGPADHPYRAAYLSTLGLALRTRFERTGNLADLDEAVDAGRAAVAATPIDHRDRAKYLSTLALALKGRFERMGSQADLDAAIDVSHQAVAVSPPDYPGRAGYLSNLGLAMRERFLRTGSQADLDAAIDASRQAVAAIPADHPDRAAMLSTLGSALRIRFKSMGSQDDLDEAVTVDRDAVAAVSVDHPDRAGYLSNLGLSLHARFERAGRRGDIDEAVDAGREAVTASPADHPDRARRLSNLGDALLTRFARIGDLADLNMAIDTSREAVTVRSASPRVRARAARDWGRAAAGRERWPDAVKGFTAAVELLGQVAPRSLTRGDQEYLIEELSGLGSDAAACCVHAGLTDQAVELFEQGRGVLLGQALDTRTDLTSLAERYPDLAGRFSALRDELDQADDDAGHLVAITDRTGWFGTDDRTGVARGAVERRREVVDAFEQVIAEIRVLPGFAGFLRPSPVAELAAAASGGSVVVVNVSRFGSHALVLTSGGVAEPVPLLGLTPDAVHQRVVAFLDAIDDTGSHAGERAEQQLVDTLGWLWDVLAGPILDQLGFTSLPRVGEPWPRLWWCTSGLLSFLPVHAAGHHHTRHDPEPATVLDRVVSSYTPTIRALAHARRTFPANYGDGVGMATGLGGGRIVAVAMPHTPGASDLPGAETEAAILQDRLGDRVTVLTGLQATREAVIRELPGARWTHFACHGSSDLANPSANRLLLADHEERPLTVVDVARQRLDGSELAFLSACSTARPGTRLADEAIHLASAFQLAGYRHVIGTLWPIGDTHAVAIADDIYTTLAGAGAVDVAGAVHTATRWLRDRSPALPSVWASHIHVGA